MELGLQKFKQIFDLSSPYNEKLQASLGRDRLLVYVIYLLKKNKIEPLFQRISVMAHKLFPDSFSLTEFKEYPDTRIVRNTLWHCVDKSKEWLSGSDKSGYSLTKKGEEIAYQIENLLENKISLDVVKAKQNIKKIEFETIMSDKEKKFVSELRDTKAYQDYLGKKKLRAIDVKIALLGTRYTSLDILKDNLSKFIEYASKFEKYKDISKFLIYLDDNWKKVFED